MSLPGGGGGLGYYTGQGGVGGARGVGAGSARVFIDFITRYNRGDVQQIAADLDKLHQQQLSNANSLRQAMISLANEQAASNRAQAAASFLDPNSKDKLAALVKLQLELQNRLTLYGKESLADIQKRNQAWDEYIAAVKVGTTLSEQDAQAIAYQTYATDNLARREAEIVSLKEQDAAITQEITEKQAVQNGLLRDGKAIQALLVGAIGGVIGGAIVSTILFQPLQAGMDAIANLAQEIVDPSKRATAAIADLGKQINGLISDQTLTRLEAAKKLISDIQPTSAQGLFNPEVLAKAGQVQALKDLTDKISSYKDLFSGGGVGAVGTQSVDTLAHSLAELARAEGDVRTQTEDAATAYKDGNAVVVNFTNTANGTVAVVADMNYYTGQAQQLFDALGISAGKSAAQMQQAADAALSLTENLSNSALSSASDGFKASLDQGLSDFIAQRTADAQAQIDQLRADQASEIQGVQDKSDARIKALQRQSSNLRSTPSSRTTGLQNAIDALSNAGPSARTTALQNQIDSLNAAQDKAQFKEQLSQIAEQRHAILLRERLALQEQINLSQFKGADRVVALQAEVDALQKRNTAEARYNQLLDIQQQIETGVGRNSGESVQAFLTRRSEFYRKQLEQAASVHEQEAVDALNTQKQQAQDEVDLTDLTDKRKKLIADRAHQQFLKRLQDELQASKDADQKALEERRKSLQKQLEASRQADQNALDKRRQTLQDEIDAERKHTQERITEIQKAHDKAVQDAESARDIDIHTAQQAHDNAIQQQQDAANKIKDLISKSNADQRALALQNASTLDQIYSFAGGVAGAGYSEELLRAQAESLGLSPFEINALLTNATHVHDAYEQALRTLDVYSHDSRPPGLASGGVFGLRNSMNFGNNMRVGEQGDEIGFRYGKIGGVLSHAVVEELRRGQSGPLIGGDVVMQSSGDLYRDEFRMRRMIRDVVDERLQSR